MAALYSLLCRYQTLRRYRDEITLGIRLARLVVVLCPLALVLLAGVMLLGWLKPSDAHEPDGSSRMLAAFQRLHIQHALIHVPPT